ncbi:ubiquitin-related domain-containing protein [Infundibulicybe gibba]|nr:ubiquitin-related domain-containing protein [Infundibulicybe gibba]
MSEQEPQPEIPQVPQTPLTFLLISGRRRTMNFAPEYTIGRVKELIWNAWPEDWKDDRPPAPSYLRILYLGKMLQDDETLNRLKLPTTLSTLTPTIVHLSIRPYAPPNEQDGFKKKRGRGRSGDSMSIPCSNHPSPHTALSKALVLSVDPSEMKKQRRAVLDAAGV